MQNWILSLTGTAMLTAAAVHIAPEGRVRKVVQLVCSFAMVLALVSPIRQFDYTAFASSLAGLRSSAEMHASEMEDTNGELSRLFIQRQCESYIMDKGASFGVSISAAVAMRWSTEGYWYPVSAEITGDVPADVQSRIETAAAAELGLPASSITWRTDGEDG